MVALALGLLTLRFLPALPATGWLIALLVLALMLLLGVGIDYGIFLQEHEDDAHAWLAVVIGAIVYRFFIAMALNSDFIGLKAQDLNLVTALLVIFALVIPQLKKRFTRRA